MYEDVLIATDGSDVATRAAAAGISLARAFGSTVHVLSVVSGWRGDTASRRTEREAAVESLAAEAREMGCEAESVVREGRPPTQILSVATEMDVDLIVLGTHGRTGIRQAVLGSVALEVIREARRPVLSVSPNASWRHDPVRIDDVLLATDGWAGSKAATEHALSLADACDATLHVLYAVDVDSTDTDLREAFERHGEEATAAVRERAREHGLDATSTVTEGTAHESVLECVDDEGIDMVVMGTEGKSSLERFVVGSEAQRVTSNASVPVVTLRTFER